MRRDPRHGTINHMEITSRRAPSNPFEVASQLVAVHVATRLQDAAIPRRDPATWTLQLIESSVRAVHADDGLALTVAECAQAVLCNATGRYDAASVLAARASDRPDVGQRAWALAELVEASVRTGDVDLAAGAVARLAALAAPGDDRTRALLARSRALLASGPDAEALYGEAIACFARAGLQMHHARAELLYGEWLRREGRRVDARAQLRRAADRFGALDATEFADRAARELSATCETVRRSPAERYDELTAQEAEIARLARDGHTNPEIAVMLFISPRTVEWHLRKVFAKLGITSRRALRTIGPSSLTATPAAAKLAAAV
jgi:DNA-binding CsgD family transcriptional regulator